MPTLCLPNNFADSSTERRLGGHSTSTCNNDFRPQQQPNKRNKISARYVVRKAEGIGGDPIPDDEPCFVVRGQDVLAPALLGEKDILRYREAPGYDPEV